MKKFYTLFFAALAFISISGNAQTVNFEWAKQIGGTSSEIAQSIAIDADGNVYITGYFDNTVDFDPGPGIYDLISAGTSDIFVCKFAPSGNLLWAKQMGGLDPDVGFSIAVDANSNSYLTGFFSGTADFDPGIGVYELNSSNGIGIFVCKLDGSGNFLWARQMSNGSSKSGYSIAVDASGNVYTTGYFYNTVDFDPGPGIYYLTGGGDIFISKLDASGNFLWAKQMGGSGHDVGFSIKFDVSGNIYTTGSFQSTADFDPGIGVYELNSSNGGTFISKLDASGNFLWAKQLGGGGNSIAIDANGNLYLTGSFSGNVDLDPGNGIYDLTSFGGIDIFVSKLDASGNFLWAKQIGGEESEKSYSIAADASGNVYTTGEFNSTADFDPGTGIYELVSSGSNDIYNIFVSKLDASGNFLWAKQMGGGGDDENNDTGLAIAVDNSGNVYTTGRFTFSSDFDPGPGTYNLTSNGGTDIFLTKFSQGCIEVSISTQPTDQSAIVGSTATFTVEADGTAPFTYQWKKNGVDLDGANDASYTTPTLAVTDDGNSYSCLVTNCEGSYSVTSSEAILTVCAVTPTVQTKNISFSSDCANEVVVSWTNGNGGRRVVKMNTANSFSAPADGTDPEPNAAYSGSGEQVIYNGAGNTVTVSGLSPNTTYWFRVYEANCSGGGSLYNTSTAANNPRKLNTSSGMTLTFTTTPTCADSEDGTVTVDVSGGTGYKTYLWNTTPPATTSTITGLAAGSYTVTVTDSRGCTVTGMAMVLAAPAFSITSVNVTPYGNNKYSALINTTGGTPPFYYTSCLNCVFHPDNPIDNLSEGIYSFYAIDGNGCVAAIHDVEVPQFPGQFGDCPYPIIFIHGLKGDGTTWSELYNNMEFQRVWGGLSDIFESINNASTSTKLEDDVQVNFVSNNFLLGGCLYAINMDNVPVPINSSSSNQSAIMKSGYVIQKAIEKVLAANPTKKKVILAGHSMGGLGAREYLQRTEGGTPNTQHKWWVAPNQPDGHKVIKLFTVGTPHRGSNLFGNSSGTENRLSNWFLPDPFSEAVRDLRYNYELESPEEDYPGLYLYGGDENIVNDNTAGINFYNYDVNCDGDVTDGNIVGINQAGSPNAWDGTKDNPYMPLPTNVRYTYYVSAYVPSLPPDECFGDGVVCEERQWLYSGGSGTTIDFNLGESIPEPKDAENYRLSDRITTSNFVNHCCVGSTEMEDINYLVRGFDEGDYPKFAWEVEPYIKYSGMAQIRPERIPIGSNTGSTDRTTDGDWYKVYLPTDNTKIKLTVNPQPWRSVQVDLYTTMSDLYSNGDSYGNLSKDSPPSHAPIHINSPKLDRGTYYFRITHFGVQEDDWIVPFDFTVTFQNAGAERSTELGDKENAIHIGEIYPHPVSATFNLDIFSPTDGSRATLKLYSPLGQQVLVRTETLSAGENNLAFSMEGQSSGIYFRASSKKVLL